VVDASRLESLDVARFAAAAAVMLYHYIYHFTDPSTSALPLVESVTRHGYLGVDVFFVISGFVILYSTRGRTATQFARARALRLYPEFWIAVLVSAAIFSVVPDGFAVSLDLGDLLANLTMVPSYLGAPYVDGVYWTLAVELKFYVLVFVLLAARQIGRTEGWLSAWLVLSLVATVIDVGGAVRSAIIFPYGPLFASGGLFSLVFASGWTPSRVAGIPVGLYLSAHHAVLGMSEFVETAHISMTAKVATVGVIVVTFLFFSLLGHFRLPARFRSAAAVGGALTYPLYLLHNTGKEIFLLGGADGARPLRVLGAIVLSLSLAWLVMRVGSTYVKPLLRLALDRTFDRRMPARHSEPL
jgi:peptidoglycan/LPS O-acetylase OafA/YrhL